MSNTINWMTGYAYTSGESRRAIMERFQTPSFTESMTSLLILDTPTNDLNGIEILTALKVLTLPKNWIRDLSPLRRVHGLLSLCLSENLVRDISPLIHMKDTLERLDLTENPIRDYTPLRHFKKLTDLDLAKSRFDDLSYLMGLEQLRVLNLEGCLLRDVSALTRLESLESLHLTSNRITDISFLVHMPHLRFIRIDKNAIEDITPLKKLPASSRLKTIYLTNNLLDGEKKQMNMETVEELKARGINVDCYFWESDAPKSTPPGFKGFRKEGNKMVVFKDPALEAAVRSAINKPHGKLLRKEVKQIRTLNAKRMGIEHLDGIEHLTGLESLMLQHNAIEDIQPLANLKNLQYISLAFNKVSEVKPLANLTSLEQLNLAYNRVEYIDELRFLPKLNYLSLEHNRLEDMDAIWTIQGLGPDSKVNLEMNFIDFRHKEEQRRLAHLQDIGVEVIWEDQGKNFM